MDTIKQIEENFKIDKCDSCRIVKCDEGRDFLPKLFNQLNCRYGAEIGVRKGEFSKKILDQNQDLHMLLIDHWIIEREYNYALKLMSKYNVKLIKKESIDAIRHVKKRTLDFIYIDANHSFDHVMNDIILWSSKVKTGGIVSGHDYDHSGVKAAVDIYIKMHKITDWYLFDTSFLWIKR